MKWFTLVKYLVVSDIIAIIPVNKRQKMNWLDCLTANQIAKNYQRLYWLMSLDVGIWTRYPSDETYVF